MKSPMEKMAERVREAILAAAFIQEGLHDFGYEAFLAYTDTDGAIEKVEAAVGMAQVLGMVAVYAMDNDMIDGVFHYEVSAEYGAAYADTAVREGRALTTKDSREILRELLLNYFLFCEDEKVQKLLQYCGLTQERENHND